MKKLVLAILVWGSFALLVQAQERVITGTVCTFDSIPVVGVRIQVLGTETEVKSDSLGHFSVPVQGVEKLRFSARGFYSEKVKLTPKTKIVAVNLRLKPTEKARSYAIGYGYVRDAERLNAVAQMTSNDANFSQYADMYELIRGRFAGVQINNRGEIIIRGVNSINASSAALIVLDGVPCDNDVLTNLAPVNVRSINILKDGGAAIYGSRGANGVVLIETKRGND